MASVFGQAAGSAIGKGAGNLVSPVLVQAASGGLGSALGGAAGSAIGSGLGSGIGSAVGGSLVNGSSKPQQQPQQQPQGDVTTVDPITVTAPATVSAPASLIPSGGFDFSSLLSPSAAIAQALAGSSFGGGGGGYAPAPEPLLNMTPVSPITVSAQKAASESPLVGLGPMLGLGDALTHAPTSIDLSSGADASGDQGGDGKGAVEDAASLAPLGLLGLLKKGGGLLQLLAGAVPIIKALDPSNPGSPGNPINDPTKPTQALTDLAGTNRDLAGRLAATADAGMAGNIGGDKMNSIAKQVRQAQAAIRSKYASMGMSGSTAELQDLQGAEQAGVEMQFKEGQDMAQQALQTVASLTGQSANIYAEILRQQTARTTELGNALTKYVGAMTG